jgi:hypothetical protein
MFKLLLHGLKQVLQTHCTPRPLIVKLGLDPEPPTILDLPALGKNGMTHPLVGIDPHNSGLAKIGHPQAGTLGNLSGEQ